MSFFFVVAATFAVLSLALLAMGLDLVTALTAVASCLNNIGPGLGPVVGPAGNYVPLPDAATWVLSGAMLAGRLEYFSLLVLLMRRFWQD